MNAEQLRKEQLMYEALTTAAEDLRQRVQDQFNYDLRTREFDVLLHLHRHPVAVSISKRNHYDVSWMKAELTEDGLTFVEYGDYTKVDAYLVKQHIEAVLNG